MKNFVKSQATFDTYKPRHTNLHLHNCPTCNCKCPQNVSLLSNCLSQPLLQYNNTAQNLYLTRESNETLKNNRFSLGRISILQNKIQFQYQNGLASPKSPIPMNIRFSYVSPPTKYRRYHSHEGRFSTKKFKDKHFPHITRDESNDKPVKKIVKNISSKNACLQIFTDQQTPQKHKILKMNKVKQKMDNSLSNQSSEKETQKNQQNVLPSNIAKESHQRKKRETPINALRIQMDQKNNSKHLESSKHLQSSQSLHNKVEDIIPKSIELVKSQHIHEFMYDRFPALSKDNRQKLERKNNQNIQNIEEPPLLSKFQTVNSLDFYESKRYEGNPSQNFLPYKEKDYEIGRKLGQQQFTMNQQQKPDNLEQQLAHILSEELSLNYDYYIPINDSDRSLSANVSL